MKIPKAKHVYTATHRHGNRVLPIPWSFQCVPDKPSITGELRLRKSLGFYSPNTGPALLFHTSRDVLKKVIPSRAVAIIQAMKSYALSIQKQREKHYIQIEEGTFPGLLNIAKQLVGKYLLHPGRSTSSYMIWWLWRNHPQDTLKFPMTSAHLEFQLHSVSFDLNRICMLVRVCLVSGTRATQPAEKANGIVLRTRDIFVFQMLTRMSRTLQLV
ncbi:hypothetical protein HCDG_01400 [Histoplasma capsulatum H143]|uniref:Uncharacterized protein n=1 Tax=Ajellomyces capsulatus (strain H143) TaxID=544712 RepID=C6H4G1_AJECH|nr:hypothetical protein HCDG_01400 [Histoplasma capsulatum H143]